MALLRMEWLRYIVFCIVLLSLVFSQNLSVGSFFLLSAGFVLMNKIIEKKGLNKEPSNKWFVIGYVALVIATVGLIYVMMR